MHQKFSPIYISQLFIVPLRYMFEHYAPEQLKYDPDPTISKIDIGTVNDFNKEKIQGKPRILVNRGPYTIRGTGLTDNMSSSDGPWLERGLNNRQNFVLIEGNPSIIIESTNEGTCELVTDIVTHFLIWSRTMLCDSQQFKTMFMPMMVSPCMPGKEDKEIFQSQVSFTYTREEHWEVNEDAIKLRKFYTNIALE